MKANHETKKRAAILLLVVGYASIVGLLMIALPILLPAIGYWQSLMASVVASMLICGFAMSMAEQPGGSAAHDFFVKSARGNSRAVIVITTTEDLREVMFKLKLAGLQPMRATV